MSELEGLKKTILKQKEQIATLQSKLDKMKPVRSLEYIPLVYLTNDWRPQCEIHGSMLAVNPECNLYRCPECGIGVDITNIITFKGIHNAGKVRNHNIYKSNE